MIFKRAIAPTTYTGHPQSKPACSRTGLIVRTDRSIISLSMVLHSKKLLLARAPTKLMPVVHCARARRNAGGPDLHCTSGAPRRHIWRRDPTTGVRDNANSLLIANMGSQGLARPNPRSHAADGWIQANNAATSELVSVSALE